MEKEARIVKVYSNNSKKSRLKRKKNKFQRIWDAEKQTYIKVRKSRFAVYLKKEKVEKSIDQQVKDAYKKAERKKTKRRVPVNATQMSEKIAKLQQKSEKKVIKQQVEQPVQKAKEVSIKVCGNTLVWSEKENRYKKVA